MALDSGRFHGGTRRKGSRGAGRDDFATRRSYLTLLQVSAGILRIGGEEDKLGIPLGTAGSIRIRLS